MHTISSIDQLGTEVHDQAQLTGYRYCVVLAGIEKWGTSTAESFLKHYSPENILYLGSGKHPDYPSLELRRSRQVLGNECDALIYNAYDGLDPDTLGITGGTIRAGGLLIIVAPEFPRWPDYDDPEHARMTVYGQQSKAGGNYIRHFTSILDQDPHTLVIRQDQPLPIWSPKQRNSSDQDSGLTTFSDQQQAVTQIIKVVEGQRRRPTVLLSDRGRGKSAALGIAAGRLLNRGLKRIIVTGHSRQSVDNVFKHAKQESELTYERLEYMPADKLIADHQPTDMLLIDEAASIPLSLLKKLLTHYSRIAFASTVHGYEGTGRSFILRFSEILDKQTRGWRQYELKQPIRWPEGDPLEALLFRLLMLDSEPSDSIVPCPDLDACRFEPVDRERLANNETLLREIFGLLVLSHYRTRPYDLRHLLDAANLSLFRIIFQQQTIGVAVISLEGGFNETVSSQIWLGKQRPHGHLLPETMIAQQGLLDAGRMQMARIVRVAIHPSVQNQRVGTTLIKALCGYYKERVDIIGSSFGASPRLLGFWQRNDFSTVRIGFNPSDHTGTHSCMVIRALSEQGVQLCQKASNKFRHHLPHQLKTVLTDVDPDLIARIYPELSIDGNLTDEEFNDLVTFAYGRRNPDNILATLQKLGEISLSRDSGINEEIKTLLIQRLLQGKEWHVCAVDSRKQGVEKLRIWARETLQSLFDGQLEHLRHRFQGLV